MKGNQGNLLRGSSPLHLKSYKQGLGEGEGMVNDFLDQKRLESKLGSEPWRTHCGKLRRWNFVQEVMGSHWMILSKAITCLDFTFIKITLTALWKMYQRVPKLDGGRLIWLRTIPTLTAVASSQHCNDSRGKVESQRDHVEDKDFTASKWWR